jgi:kinesin family protein 15
MLRYITVYDLLNGSKSDVIIRDDPCKGIVLENVIKYEVSTYEDFERIFHIGVNHRKSASTIMNIESSRSHGILTVYLECCEGLIKRSAKLNIVDLAGSERIDKHFDRSGENEARAKETGNINKSLLCLGKVIKSLSSGTNGHVCYRDSKLTFLLKDSLGGNSKLIVIGNVSQEKDHLNDSINTLKFLKRIKMIKNDPVINADVDGGLEDLKR